MAAPSLIRACRHPGAAACRAAVAHKIEAAIYLGRTHFIESDLSQAVLIAEHAPLLRIIWWDAVKKAGKIIGARNWRNEKGD